MATGSGDGRGEEVGARVVVGAAVTGGGASGESLAASEHAAATMIRKIGTNRDATTRARLGIRSTEYQQDLRCDEWEVVVPELVFDLARLYRRLSLRDVFLSFAGTDAPAIRRTAPLIFSLPL